MTDRVSLRQLRAFQAVMESGSITVAAERLNLTQPAISKQIALLEGHLNLKLFHRRSGSAISPSGEAIEFFRSMERTLSGLDELEDIARDIGLRKRSRVVVAGTPPLINSAPMARALSRLCDHDHKVHVMLEVRHRLEIEDWIVKRQIDFGLALLPAHDPTLKVIPLAETEMVAVMHDKHPLARNSFVSADDLVRERVILPKRQLIRSKIDETLTREGIPLVPFMESSSSLTGCRMAAEGLGIMLCDPFSPSSLTGSKLAIRPWQPRIPLTFGIMLLDPVALDAAQRKLLEFIRAEFSAFSTTDLGYRL